MIHNEIFKEDGINNFMNQDDTIIQLQRMATIESIINYSTGRK